MRANLANASTSGRALRAYRGDLDQFAAHYDGQTEGLDAAIGASRRQKHGRAARIPRD
jgi:hypothetical protein